MLSTLVDALRPLGLEATRLAGFAYGLVNGPVRAVEDVFPSLGPGRARLVAARTESHRVLGYVLRRVSRVLGDDWLVRATQVRGEEVVAELQRQGRPIVVVSWHTGVAAAVPAGLARLGLRGVVVRRQPTLAHRVPGFEMLLTSPGMQGRAITLTQCLAALRRDLVVVVFGDASTPNPGRPTRPFLGRAAEIRGGPAAMARLAKAAIVPVEGRLERGRIVLEIFPPLAPGPDDDGTTDRLVAFFEPRVARDPGALWRSSLEILVGLARVP